MTKKELLESEAFMALPDNGEIVFRTSQDIRHCLPLTSNKMWVEKRITNMDFIEHAPVEIRDEIKREYGIFLVIDALPHEFMKNEYGLTFGM